MPRLWRHARRVVRKNSVTRSKARGSIRDAIRRGSDWHGLHMILRGDGANWPFASRDTRAADREHPDPAVVRKYCAQLRQGTANTRDAAPSTDLLRTEPQLKNLESIASEIRVTGSIRRGFIPCSTYRASCGRKNKFSALSDCVERNVSRHQRSVSPISWTTMPQTPSILGL